jgi:hypothetical protein
MGRNVGDGVFFLLCCVSRYDFDLLIPQFRSIYLPSRQRILMTDSGTECFFLQRISRYDFDPHPYHHANGLFWIPTTMSRETGILTMMREIENRTHNVQFIFYRNTADVSRRESFSRKKIMIIIIHLKK